ncbi:hypothetical protein [Parasitella parasitica]|uniref:Uncharacterized protein n=1 Tax=Parasitella parasitica TaxID=35722 RepID=A0A0B7NLB0_9FUNG|nr:hypothetical protein [Parasitella parasitica]
MSLNDDIMYMLFMTKIINVVCPMSLSSLTISVCLKDSWELLNVRKIWFSKKWKLSWCLLRRHIFHGNNFRKNNRAVFATPSDCLDRFELVMQAHPLSIIAVHWDRMVPSHLSTIMARCLANSPKSTDMREQAREEEQENLRYQSGQSLDVLFNKFQSLRKQTQINDQEFVKRFLLKALPEALANHAQFDFNRSDPALTTVEMMLIDLVKSIFDAFLRVQ